MVPMSLSWFILFYLCIGTNSNPVLQGLLPTELINFPSPQWTSLVVNSYYIVFCPHFLSAICHLAFSSCLQHISKRWAGWLNSYSPLFFPSTDLDMIWPFPSNVFIQGWDQAEANKVPLGAKFKKTLTLSEIVGLISKPSSWTLVNYAPSSSKSPRHILKTAREW